MFKLFKVYGSFLQAKNAFEEFMRCNQSVATTWNVSRMDVTLDDKLRVFFVYAEKEEDLIRYSGMLINAYEIDDSCYYFREVDKFFKARIRSSN